MPLLSERGKRVTKSAGSTVRAAGRRGRLGGSRLTFWIAKALFGVQALLRGPITPENTFLGAHLLAHSAFFEGPATYSRALFGDSITTGNAISFSMGAKPGPPKKPMEVGHPGRRRITTHITTLSYDGRLRRWITTCRITTPDYDGGLRRRITTRITTHALRRLVTTARITTETTTANMVAAVCMHDAQISDHNSCTPPR